MTAQHLKFHFNIPNFKFDPRGVREVESTRRINPVGMSPLFTDKQAKRGKKLGVNIWGKDKDGAFRMNGRLDKKDIT